MTKQEVGESPTRGTWSRQDPRWHVGKRGDIIVEIDGQPYRASVDVKETYCIFLQVVPPDKRSFIGENDEWPNWRWSWWMEDVED